METEELSGVPQLLTTKEAAVLLGVSTHTLTQWRKQRRHLPFVHIGGQVRYHLDTIKRFMEVGTFTPRPAGLDGRSIELEERHGP